MLKGGDKALKKLIQVGKCLHCGDPIYKFQVEAHRGCVREYEFNPDYLNFDNGVYAGKVLENERIRKNIQLIGAYWLRHDNVEGFSMTKEEFEQALKLEVESDIEL